MIDAVELQAQLQEKWLVLWWALVISAFVIGLAWRHGFFSLVKKSFIPIITGLDVFKGFGFYLGGVFLAAPLLFAAVSMLAGGKAIQFIPSDPLLKGWFNLCMIIGGFLGACLAYFLLTKEQRQQLWRQTTIPWYRNVGFGMLAWFVIYPVVVAIGQLISIMIWFFIKEPSVEQVAVQHLRKIMSDPWLFGVTALAVTSVVPITEEFLFRGLLQNWLKRKFQSIPAGIVLSSLIFAIVHFSSLHGISNIELLISLFILSCMLGFIYERQHSLWASVGLHGFFNLVSLLFILRE